VIPSKSNRARALVSGFLSLGAGALAACSGKEGIVEDTAVVRRNGKEERALEREEMVEHQLARRGIKDARVLAAMRRVPRHRFVPEAERGAAYADSPLPIGQGQTISQPYIVAYMSQALDLDGSERVLEIGSGSGYQSAILGELAREVWAIEILEPLAERSKLALQELGYRNVHVRSGDGYLGWPEHAPFDAILVAAAPDHVPQPLLDQLAPDGRMILPVGTERQELLLIRRTEQGIFREQVMPVRFVPMTGIAEDGDSARGR
jgi:protein-L-isoaspartate(D-aspartate) O-methyltransferase